jgi:hypothetical protein
MKKVSILQSSMSLIDGVVYILKGRFQHFTMLQKYFKKLNVKVKSH